MKRISASWIAAALIVLGLSGMVSAQIRRGDIIIPKSGIAEPGDAGVKMHTTYQIYSPRGVKQDSSQPTGETPASLGCVYGLVENPISGCPKATSTSNPTGGSGVIVLVDAFDYPTAAQDLATFSTQFGLPAPKFHQIYTGGVKPQVDCGWEGEEALDIEWAHAMAPDATIVLVESQTNFTGPLMAGVNTANRIITNNGGKGEVSMSWQGGEFPHQRDLDLSAFTAPGVVYFASSGDRGGAVGWPSTSPNVVSAGGTSVNRDTSGNFTNETGWSGSGGGDSSIEPRPNYQDGIQNIVGSHRGTPDFSFDANPFTGVSVYISDPGCGAPGWQTFGGTSVSSPALAGVVNSTGSFRHTTRAEQKLIYGNLGDSSIFTDITQGQAGGNKAGPGWDFVTGVGTDVGKNGK